MTLTETLGGDAYLYVRLAGGQVLVVRAEGDTALDHGAEIGLDCRCRASTTLLQTDGRSPRVVVAA